MGVKVGADHTRNVLTISIKESDNEVRSTMEVPFDHVRKLIEALVLTYGFIDPKDASSMFRGRD